MYRSLHRLPVLPRPSSRHNSGGPPERGGFGGGRGGRGGRGRGGPTRAPSAKQILADESRGVFRELDLGRPNPRVFLANAPLRERYSRISKARQDRADIMSPYQDWESVWPTARTFHPAVVPLPIRQGFIHLKTQVHPAKKANVELMKIPNFLHATPPVIEKQCKLIKQWCTEWPKGEVEKCYPVEVTTSTYLNSSSSIRDHRARKVSFSFPLKMLKRNPKFREEKFRRLVENRYDEDTGMVTIEADCCPYRSQNEDYANYLMTAVFHESCKTEKWEDSKTEADMVNFDFDLRDESMKPTPGSSEEATMNHRTQVKTLLEQGEDEKTLKSYKDTVQALYNLKPFEAAN